VRSTGDTSVVALDIRGSIDLDLNDPSLSLSPESRGSSLHIGLARLVEIADQ